MTLAFSINNSFSLKGVLVFVRYTDKGASLVNREFTTIFESCIGNSMFISLVQPNIKKNRQPKQINLIYLCVIGSWNKPTP
jgi:hypothetical protein